MNVKSELARNFFIARISNNLNQIELVKKSGLTRPILSGIESGSANPSIETILKLSNSLRINIDSLLMSEKKYLKLKKMLKTEFENSKRSDFELYIPETVWKKLLKFSDVDQKQNYKSLASLCYQIIRLNFGSAQEQDIIRMKYFSMLGIIFQKDGFLSGIEFGIWFSNNVYD